MKTKSVLKSVSWLTIGLVIAKFFGGIYKLLLTRILGGENLGVYQQVMPIYSFLIVLITSGVPLGISKLLAEKSSQEKSKLITSCVKLFTIVAVVVGFVLFLLAGRFAYIQGNTSLKTCYYLMIPSLIFSALSAVFKGYFQGENEFSPTAVSQIAEQIAKIILGLGLALIFAKQGVFAQIVGIIIGIGLADFVNFIVLIVFFKKNKNKLVSSNFNKKDIKELLAIVLPIMLASLIIPLSQMVDSFLVVKLLNKNFVKDTSVYLYGLQSGVVATLVNIPAVFTFSISTVLLPRLTLDFKMGNESEFSKKVVLAFKVLILFAVPSGLFILFFPHQFISLIYGDVVNGFNINGQMLSSKLLLFSAVNVVLLCISQLFSICLQARNKKYKPAINNLLGMLVKTILIICFVPSRELNILAFTLATSVGYFVIFALNLIEIQRDNILIIRSTFWIKLAIANVVVIASSIILFSIQPSNVNFVLVCLVSIVFYFVILWYLKPFNKKEINNLLTN